MDQKFQNGPEYPKMMDNNDVLGHFRNRFFIKKGTIYLCGNSLGLCSKDAEECLLKVLEQWKQDGVKIWNVDNNKYFMYTNHLAKLTAPLINADPEEIVMTGSTTSNIHQAISTLYKPANHRYKILVDNLNFPTDRYAVDSQVRLKGYEPKDAVKVVESRDGRFVDEDDIIQAMTEDVILVLLPTVIYKSAQILDMEKITKVARERDIIMGWDLCHAIGVLDIDLKALDTDFAVWCTYKYLNGGPGSTAGMYLNKRHFQKLPGLAGWYGNKKKTQFLLQQEFDHQEDASGCQIGSPAILSMAPLEGSLKILSEAGIGNVRKKSLHITGYLMFLVETKLGEYGFVIGNGKDDSKRGGHVCIVHEEAYRLSLAMKDNGVVADFREPDVIRLTPAALYTSYVDVYKVVAIMTDIIKTESFKKFSNKRGYVV